MQEYAFGVLQVSDPRKTKSVVEDYIKGLSDEEKRSIQSFSAIRPFIKARGAQAFPDSYLFNTFVENIEHYASQMDAKMIETGNFWHTLYLTFVRMPSLLYRNANAGRGNMETYTQAVQQLKSMNLPFEDIFIKCLKAEEAFSDKDFEKGILKTKAILDQHGATYPILYSSLLYSMTYAGYFLEGDQLHGDKVLKLTEDFLKALPCKMSLIYYAAANRNVGDIKTAMSAMAWTEFYPGPTLSNAYYKFFGYENIRSKFPID